MPGLAVVEHGSARRQVMKLSQSDRIIIVVVLVFLLFGGVSFKAENLKLDKFEAGHIEQQMKGV
jgi:hypothetical protein